MKYPIEVQRRVLDREESPVADFLELIKFRIGIFVVLSALVGFVLGSGGTLDLTRLLHMLLATFMVSSGSAALNQLIERDQDAQMRRTADRPLPAGRLDPEQAHLIGVVLSAVGIGYLGLWVNWLTSVLAALTIVIYLLFYTPLKPRSVHNTVVGAISGALPPVGGWTAATGELGVGAGVLFAILFLWQFPHFFSIAWIYREDYARGGYRMLSVEDPGGSRTAFQMVLYSLVLVPFSIMPWFLGLTGAVYFCVALCLSASLVVFSLVFAKSRARQDARRLLRATLVYLPVLWMVMVLDRLS
ncbi:MAG: heme o synthase [bacterium]|nr:heme o synthase [bacterium]